jgi:hypothetical protein
LIYKRLSDQWGGQDPHQAAIFSARHPTPDMMKRIMSQPDIDFHQAGSDHGKGYVDGVADGANNNMSAADQAGTNVGGTLHKKAKKALDSNSPSLLGVGLGADYVAGLAIGVGSSGGMLASGMGAALDAASTSVRGIANNSGLAVGYVYARGVESGMDSVMKSADFMAAAVPQIPSQLATTALGQEGLLGPSGGGGQIEKALSVDLMNTSSAAQPMQITNVQHIYLDGKYIDTKISNAVIGAFDTFQTGMRQG